MPSSIGGGRFEALYKEVLPILEEMLETLNNYSGRVPLDFKFDRDEANAR